MKNPFSYSGIVTDKPFCNRKEEQEQIIDLIRNSQNILLYSYRKTGKSSLIYNIFRKLKHEIQTIYIDLYGTVSEQDFINAVFTGLSQIEPQYKKIMKYIPGLKIMSSIDPITGFPSVSVSTESFGKKVLLAKAMQTLETYSKKKRIVVGFDEFQEISGYSEKSFEKRLRSFIQLHNRISYIFSGSQEHLLSEMFNSSERAFYKSTYSFPLKKIEKQHYVSWAKNLFAEKKVDLPESIIEDIVKRCDHQPLYIQQFLYKLWKARNINSQKIIDIEKEIILGHRNEYISIFDSLTANQKKTLKLIAKTDGNSIYQSGQLNSVGLNSASLLNRAIQSLLKKELISKNGRYHIQDIMLKKWILLFL